MRSAPMRCMEWPVDPPKEMSLLEQDLYHDPLGILELCEAARQGIVLEDWEVRYTVFAISVPVGELVPL